MKYIETEKVELKERLSDSLCKKIETFLNADSGTIYVGVKDGGEVSVALFGDGASLGYICQEMCHFILIHVFGIGPKLYKSSSGMILAKTVSNRPGKVYMSM